MKNGLAKCAALIDKSKIALNRSVWCKNSLNSIQDPTIDAFDRESTLTHCLDFFNGSIFLRPLLHFSDDDYGRTTYVSLFQCHSETIL